MYNGGNVTEILWVDKCSEWELLLLLDNWYKFKSFNSIFFLIAFSTVDFSSQPRFP